MPRTLVVYYSRTGTTQKVAEQIADALGCEIEALVGAKSRTGGVGWMSAAKDAAMRRATEIKPVSHDPAEYELVVIGTPVWAFTMSCAVRTYLQQHRDRLPDVAFFLTTGGSGIKGTFEHMQELAGREPIATLGLRMKDVLKGRHTDELKAFVESLR